MATENDLSVRNESVSPEESASNKSFVKKVTSRVSGFLPSSLSKWFGNTETTVRPRDETDDEEMLRIQPPAKKVKANESPIRNNHRHSFVAPRSEIDRSKNNVNCVKFSEPIAGPSGLSIKRHSSATKAALNTNLCTTKQGEVRNCDNNSDSGESTSGYSSMRVGSKELVTEQSEQVKRNPVTSPVKSKTLFDTPSKLDRSLFNDRTSSPHMNTSLSTRQPSFNSTAFGTPNFIDRTLSSKRILDSPFYSGRTTYGGASAYGRRLAPQRSEDNSAILRNIIQIKPVNEKKSDSTSLSKTARRILDTLEQYTAPTADTKKIPNPPKKSARYTHINPYAIRETKVPSNRELQVPTVPDLLKMKLKEKMQNTTVSVRRIANSSKCSLNTEEYKIATLEDNNSKHSNKIKNKISSMREKPQLNETMKVVKLPDVPLPITTLPVFNFSIPTPSTSNIPKPVETVSSTTTTVKTTEKIIVGRTEKSIEVKKTEEIVKETLKKDNSKIEQNTSKCDKTECVKRTEYMFSDPTVLSENKNKVDALRTQFKIGADKWECKTCMVRNSIIEPKCRACTTPRTSMNGTVEYSPQKHTYTFSDPVPAVDSKRNKIFNNPVIKNDLSQFKMASDKWECSTCLIRNNITDSKCVACTTPKITNGSVLPATIAPNATKAMFGDKFKPAVDTWECSICMIRNKNNLKVCAACSSPRPTVKQENGILDKPEVKSINIFDKFKPTDAWQCPVCLISNKNDVTKCAACSTQRTEEKSAVVKPNLFDNFKPECDTWECSVCMVRNKNNVTSCVACTTLKPGAIPKQENGFGDKFKKKDDKWECGTCMVQNSAEKQKCICCDASKPGSNQPANIPKETKSVSSFNFGIVNNEAVNQMFSFATKPSENIPAKPVSSIFGQPAPVLTTTFNFGVKPVETKKENPGTTNESVVVDEKTESLPDVNKPTVPSQENLKPIPSTTTITPIKSTLNGEMNKTPILFENITKPREAVVALPSKPTFSFDATAKPQITEVNLVTPTPLSQLFTFGAVTMPSSLVSTNTSTSTVPILTTNSSSSPAPFKFGVSATTPDKPMFGTQVIEKPALFGNLTTPGSNNFGSNAVSQPVGGFSYGNVPTSSTAPSQNGTFSFGTTTEAPKPTFNFAGGPQGGSPGVFSFGGSTPSSTISSNSGGFNFSSSTDFKPNFNFTAGAPPSAFSAPAANSAPERRVIRRALRRTQR